MAIINLRDGLTSTSSQDEVTIINNTVGALALNDLSDVDTTGVANNKILKYNSTTSQFEIADDSDADAVAAVEAEGTLDLTGQLTVTNSSLPATFTRIADDQTGTMLLQKDVGAGGDMSRGVITFHAVKNDTTTKYLGINRWSDRADTGKTMTIRTLADDGQSGTDIAFFSGNSVDFQGEISIGGTGASQLTSDGDFTIDCATDTLIITAGDIQATLDGGTY